MPELWTWRYRGKLVTRRIEARRQNSDDGEGGRKIGTEGGKKEGEKEGRERDGGGGGSGDGGGREERRLESV